jgi:glycosyltransferase involved in cell wall biosynthesis
MARIRILFITHSGWLGGAPVSLDLLVRGLDRDRYEPVIACIRPNPEIMEFHARAGVTVVPAPDIRDFPHTTGGWLRLWNPRHVYALGRALAGYGGSVRATRRLIAEQQPDIVHLNSVVLAPAARAACGAGVPLVWHIRESVVAGHFGVRRRWLARQVRSLPDAAIFLSEDDMNRLGHSPRWSVIPNWVPFDEPAVNRTEARRSLGVPEGAEVVLFMGGFSRIKGTEVMLEAMKQVVRQIPDATCLLAGLGAPSTRLRARVASQLQELLGWRGYRERCKRLLADAGASIVWLPFREDTNSMFAAADVLAFPATEPHFPRPVIEAFAHRVPVVASEIGTIPLLVEDGRTGILVRPSDPDALAAGIVATLRTPDRAAERAEFAYVSARDRFSPQAGIGAVTALYEGVLAGHREAEG